MDSQSVRRRQRSGVIFCAIPHRSACYYQTVHQQVFKGRIEDRDYAVKVYVDHIAEVKATLSAGRLLNYDVKDGWQPLCEFLGEAVPAEPFPHKNTQDEFTSKRSFLKGLKPGS